MGASNNSKSSPRPLAYLSNITNAEIAPLFFLQCQYGDHNIVRCLVERDRSVLRQQQGNLFGIHIAVNSGQYGVVRTLIEIDPECVKLPCTVINNFQFGYSHPIQHAASSGKIDILKLLVESKADVDCAASTGFPPLVLCLQGRHYECAKVLVEYGADVNARCYTGTNAANFVPPFHQAYDAELLQLMLEKGADLSVVTGNGSTVLHSYCCTVVAPEIIDILLEKVGCTINIMDGSGMTPFHHALKTNNTSLIAKMIRYGADINLRTTSGCSCVFLALTSSAFDVLVHLLTLPNIDLCFAPNQSPLIHQIFNYCTNPPILEKCVSAILATGFFYIDEPDQYRQNQTPLCYALLSSYASETLICSLIASSADPNVTDTSGACLLSKVILNTQLPRMETLVRILLDAGANPNVPDVQNQFTPLYHAVCRNLLGIAKLLYEHGGDISAKDCYGMLVVQRMMNVATFTPWVDQLKIEFPKIFENLPVVQCPSRGQITCWQCGAKPNQMVYYLNNAEPNRNDSFRVQGYSAVCVAHKNYGDGMANWAFVCIL